MPKFKALPPLERLNELLEIVEIPPDKYGVWSGLVRKVSRGGQWAGSRAGCLFRRKNKPDRLDWVVGVDGAHYYSSRVIYYMAYGEDPGDAQIDHKDRNTLNNNSWNLRLDVNAEIQEVNKGVQKNNKSGVVGASWDKGTGKWKAEVKGKYLGLFTCKIEAAHAVNKKWRELGWLELGRKLNDLETIECDCNTCKSHLDEIAKRR